MFKSQGYKIDYNEKKTKNKLKLSYKKLKLGMDQRYSRRARE